jgi:hypothetical protein
MRWCSCWPIKRLTRPKAGWISHPGHSWRTCTACADCGGRSRSCSRPGPLRMRVVVERRNHSADEQAADPPVAVAAVPCRKPHDRLGQSRPVSANFRLSRCVERDWPTTAHARRSETVSCEPRTPAREGLSIFPTRLPSGSACQVSAPKQPSSGARSRAPVA